MALKHVQLIQQIGIH